MKHRKLFLYLAGACFFMMCGSLWNEFVVSKNSTPSDSLSRISVTPSVRNSVTPNPRKSYYAVPKAAVESFSFDPNEADSTQLLRLGLTPAQVRSIYRHRAKGYVYSRVEDFARTPFMTQGQWAHLRPLIKIAPQYRPLNLNDTVEKVQGSKFKVQNSFVTPKDTILHSSLFTLHSDVPHPSDTAQTAPKGEILNSSLLILNLNEASFKALVHHPFLSYGQVKAIKNFQKKYGRIRNMTELLILPEFTVEDTLRLSPYLQF